MNVWLWYQQKFKVPKSISIKIYSKTLKIMLRHFLE